MVEALKGIALKRNSALIVSIKQPSAKQFGMFDKCIFLSGERWWTVREVGRVREREGKMEGG